LIPALLQAQIPAIAEVPENLQTERRTALLETRASLLEWKSQLQARVAEHNGRCGNVAEGSQTEQTCRAARAELNTTIGQYAADVMKFNEQVRQAMAAATKPASAEQSIEQLQAKLSGLRAEIAEIQKALGELNKSIAGDQKERKFWEKTIAEASDRSMKRAIHLTADEVLAGIGDQFAKQVKSADQEIARAQQAMAQETDPNRREQLQAALQWLRGDKATIETKQVLLVDAAGKFNHASELLMEQAKEQPTTQRTLELAYYGLQRMLENPAYQKALHFSERYAPAASWAKAAIDSTYDAASVCAGWSATYQLNANSDSYILAVAKLDGRMQHAVEQIRATESLLETVRGKTVH
jgi:pantoate kinase